jgi:colicin import membrane protein
MSATETKTMIEPTLSPISGTGIAEYDNFAAGVAELRSRYEGVRFEVATVEGNKAARAARLELVKLRGLVESRRKELKAPALARSRLIDTAAKAIMDEIVAIEEPIDLQIKAEEERREAERQAKIDAEQARVFAIRANIEDIPLSVQRRIGRGTHSSDQIKAEIARVEAMVIGDEFAEFKGEAEAKKQATLSDLAVSLEEAAKKEEEKARFEAERAEFERQRAEQQKADREAREKAKAEQKAEDDRLKAERDKLEAEQKVESDRLARERREFEEKQAEAEQKARSERKAEEARLKEEQDRVKADQKAEQDRIDAERAELKRQQDEAKAKAEAEARATRDAENAAENRLRDAAPDLLAALEHPSLAELVSVIENSTKGEAATIRQRLIDWIPIRAEAISKATQETDPS